MYVFELHKIVVNIVSFRSILHNGYIVALRELLTSLKINHPYDMIHEKDVQHQLSRIKTTTFPVVVNVLFITWRMDFGQQVALRPQIPTWCDPKWKSLMESCLASELEAIIFRNFAEVSDYYSVGGWSCSSDVDAYLISGHLSMNLVANRGHVHDCASVSLSTPPVGRGETLSLCMHGHEKDIDDY
ncbi:hypothetical protein Pfo_000798 [Paulownia fortunei]|nr:hypothetical protein Pfo_000798 [Paulownia fortunei]